MMPTFFRLFALSILTVALNLSAQNDQLRGKIGTEEPLPVPEIPMLDTMVEQEAQGPIVSFAGMLEEVTPAVVGVYPSRLVTVRNNRSPLEDMLRRYYGLPGGDDNSREQRRSYGIGSGVIISADGYILTNNHVVTDQGGESADEILVRLSDDREYEARLVGADPQTDVAVLKVDADEPLPYLPLANSDNLRTGDIVFAVGNPMGVGLTVTMGIVSATGRNDLNIIGSQSRGLQGYENFIQTDASINPGNSGGPLIDAQGRIVGINAAIISGSGGNIGIGFAIPSKMARSVALSLVEFGSVQRGFLGVRIADINAEMAEAFGLEEAQGALIEEAQEGLPAALAGLRRGDIILSIDGNDVQGAADLRLMVASNRPGETIMISVVRDNEVEEFAVVLGNLDDPFATSGPSRRDDLLSGVILETLSEETRERFEIQDDISGVVIVDVSGRSPYADALHPGMVFLEINDRPVPTTSIFDDVLREGVNKAWVYSRGRTGYLAIRTQ